MRTASPGPAAALDRCASQLAVRESERATRVGAGLVPAVFGRGRDHRLDWDARASGGIGRRAGFRFQCP